MKLHVQLLQRGPMTPRQAAVLCRLCTGMTRQQIADETCRSYGCVSKQVEAIAEKLGAHSAAEIVAKAVANQLVQITIKTWLLLCFCTCCLGDQLNTDLRRPPHCPRPPLSRCHTRNQTPRFQRDT
ncbi:helix-turn-helix transcriptional regulator [Methylomonas sp. EFPC3]|uniref:response regulator transcription factor n=1 Tax=Methylomonas sp. EFPC3 TaxID=3021710 RepID=UPI00241634CB|nr:helix-turn-helix transcriptional regulator [Methylomonas sp. EFPC3]WFP48546.1 helix-turn-helix transcriptional regulator [Methylomonas sp. EFPC3]